MAAFLSTTSVEFSLSYLVEFSLLSLLLPWSSPFSNLVGEPPVIIEHQQMNQKYEGGKKTVFQKSVYLLFYRISVAPTKQ